jgi:hypothetical protein
MAGIWGLGGLLGKVSPDPFGCYPMTNEWGTRCYRLARSPE